MRSKRNSYSGRRRVEATSTIKRRRDRAIQKAKQDDQVVEPAHERINDKPQTSIRKTEERGWFWWFASSCAVIPFMVMAAYQVCLALRASRDSYSGLEFHSMWRDWRFIAPFVVFTSQALLGLRGGRYRFWLAFPFIVLIVLLVYMLWTSMDESFYAFNQPKFWRDWRFIVPFVVFNSQAFFGLKKGWSGCLQNLLLFCFVVPFMMFGVLTVYYFFLLIIYGDSPEFQWNWQVTVLLTLTYYLTFFGIFGFLKRWITGLEQQIKTAIRR